MSAEKVQIKPTITQMPDGTSQMTWRIPAQPAPGYVWNWSRMTLPQIFWDAADRGDASLSFVPKQPPTAPQNQRD